jgi:hypothetical protein
MLPWCSPHLTQGIFAAVGLSVCLHSDCLLAEDLGSSLRLHIIHIQTYLIILLFFPVPVCAITASGVPGGTFVSMNRFSALRG